MDFLQGKFRFSKPRQSVGVVAQEVAEATGIPLERILEEIPELTKQHLAAGAYWQSEMFSESPVGVQNSLLSQGWVIVKFPVLKEFLELNFFPRSGGGIGLTRLIDAMKKGGLMNNLNNN